MGLGMKYNFKVAIFILLSGFLFYWSVERDGYEGNMLGSIYKFFGAKGILLFFVFLSLLALTGRRGK